MITRKDTETVFAPPFVMRALQSFEHRTRWILIVSWLMAFALLLLATYTLNLARLAKHEVVTLASTDPTLPQVQRQPVNYADAAIFVTQLQKRYPHIHFDPQGEYLVVTTNEGSNFREWLTALEYADITTPEWQWSVYDFCVGKCPTPDLMRAVLTAEKVGLALP